MTRRKDDRGIALITAILMLAMISALLIGATALAVSEQRSRFQVKDRTQAFQAAHSGLEKLTNDLGNLFAKTYAPGDAEIAALKDGMPDFPGVKYAWPGEEEGSGYQITKGDMAPRTLETGPYAGLSAQVTPYTMTVTAKTATEAESTLQRSLNTVAIPVFQFGIFSESDLSFFPGPDFNFGGRVHTNGNLFLAKGGSGTPVNGNQLILGDRVTAVKEIVRTNLSNGFATGPGTPYAYNVRVLTTDNGCSDVTDDDTCRKLELDEGSLVGTLNSDKNEAWTTTISPSEYSYRIRNGDTGATTLNLPLATDDAEPIDLIRRPLPGEKAAEEAIYRQRYYQYASVRILLSDNREDITVLDDASTGTPIDLDARSDIAAGIKGWIKIDKQSKDGASWTDITDDILDRGVVAAGYGCGVGQAPVSESEAIVRFQRPSGASSCSTSTTVSNHWPLNLFDPREGRLRDSAPAGGQLTHGGVMGYVELDIKNLRSWLKAQGTEIMQETGYVVYFSDRRGIRNTAAHGHELGELGFEDVINANLDGLPTGVKDDGEDVNGNDVVDVYGATSNDGSVTDFYTPIAASDARSGPVKLFRRALKLVRGNRQAMLVDNTFTPGLTIAAENPVYIQGDYNANSFEDSSGTDTWNETYDRPHISCAVVADAVTLLSNDWLDKHSFSSPYSSSGRPVSRATSYRTAVIAGKGLSFPQPSWGAQDFGTDGGTHNFLRYLEDWNPDPQQRLWYRGSLVSFYTSRQATGTYKCCVVVYDAPRRLYTYDEDFKFPEKLPPRTPMIRDLNTTSFTKLPAPAP